MLELHPQFIQKNGRKEFVVLSWEEFESLRKALKEMEDLKILEEAIKQDQNAPAMSHEEVVKHLGLDK